MKIYSVRIVHDGRACYRTFYSMPAVADFISSLPDNVFYDETGRCVVELDVQERPDA
jgi:hypothetical protein